jgi:hypothetical protein
MQTPANQITLRSHFKLYRSNSKLSFNNSDSGSENSDDDYAQLMHQGTMKKAMERWRLILLTEISNRKTCQIIWTIGIFDWRIWAVW